MEIRAEINKIETNKQKKPIQRINETKSSFFEKINKIKRPLANLTKMRRGKNPNQENQKCKRRDNNKHHRNPGNHQRLL
jgi:hypothetical protein